MSRLISEFRIRNLDWGSSAPIPQSAISTPKSVLRNRNAVTLVELLITAAIISILAAILLGVAAVAGDTAREARTKNVIARLHALLMEHYDTYKTRRVEPSIPPLVASAHNADNRLLALRELMRIEMPDRWSDILSTSVENVPPNAPEDTFKRLPARFRVQPTSLWSAYIRRYRHLSGTAEVIRSNQGAECLYLIITLATGDGEARSLFGESTIGDTDGDGALEFLDGWGNPIQFLRWAPGFSSDLQLSTDLLGKATPVERERLIAADHDPFDMYRRDVYESGQRGHAAYEHLNDERSAFRLVPLIYSAGADEEFGLHDDPRYSNATADPYQEIQVSYYLGTALDSTLTDNIHNHRVVGE